MLNVVFQSNLKNCKLAIHVFQLHDDGPATEELEEDIAAANHWLLPCGTYYTLCLTAFSLCPYQSECYNYVNFFAHIHRET